MIKWLAEGWRNMAPLYNTERVSHEMSATFEILHSSEGPEFFGKDRRMMADL